MYVGNDEKRRGNYAYTTMAESYIIQFEVQSSHYHKDELQFMYADKE